MISWLCSLSSSSFSITLLFCGIYLGWQMLKVWNKEGVLLHWMGWYQLAISWWRETLKKADFLTMCLSMSIWVIGLETAWWRLTFFFWNVELVSSLTDDSSDTTVLVALELWFALAALYRAWCSFSLVSLIGFACHESHILRRFTHLFQLIRNVPR